MQGIWGTMQWVQLMSIPCEMIINASNLVVLGSLAMFSLLRRHSFSSSRIPPQRMSAETSGYLRRPITAHFQILEVTLRISHARERTFNERVSVSDLNSYQLLLSCSSPLSPLEMRDLFKFFQSK